MSKTKKQAFFVRFIIIFFSYPFSDLLFVLRFSCPHPRPGLFSDCRRTLYVCMPQNQYNNKATLIPGETHAPCRFFVSLAKFNSTIVCIVLECASMNSEAKMKRKASKEIDASTKHRLLPLLLLLLTARDSVSHFVHKCR